MLRSNTSPVHSQTESEQVELTNLDGDTHRHYAHQSVQPSLVSVIERAHE